MSAFAGYNQDDRKRIVDSGGDELAVNADGSINVNTTLGTVEITNDVGNPIPVSDAGGSLTIDDGGGSITVDGTVTITDGSGPVTVDGTVTIGAALPAGTNNIGDVDVLTLPGGLTGRAEDSAAVSGDVGLPILAVRNDGQAALTSADGDYGMLAVDSAGRLPVGLDTRVPLGYQQATVTNASFALTVPSGARRALIQVDSADLRWRDDGTAPTAAVGMRANNGSTFEYTGDLAAIRFIRRTGSDSQINVSYYDK